MGDVALGRGPAAGARTLSTPWTVDAATLAIRLSVGVVMAYHGFLKLQNVPGFAGFVGSLGIPAPTVVAYLVTYLELLGGIAILLGVLTRYAGSLIALEMVGTTLLVKTGVGLIAPQGGGAGAELDLVILASALALALIGPGRWSVDALLAGRRSAG